MRLQDKLPKCEAILNTPTTVIDQIRAEKRLSRLPRPRSIWDHQQKFASTLAQYQAQMRMARHDREMWVDTDYSGLERRVMSYRKEEIAMLYGRPIQHMIAFDELQRWPSVSRENPVRRKVLLRFRNHGTSSLSPITERSQDDSLRR